MILVLVERETVLNLNSVYLVGRVTKTPELKTLDSGSQVVSFGLATNNVYKDKQGNKKEETDFHNITAWGKTAETIAQYVVKGQEILIQGRIRYRSWEKDGVKKYATDIICATFQFGQKPRSASSTAIPPQATGGAVANADRPADQVPPPSDDDAFNQVVDAIPF